MITKPKAAYLFSTNCTIALIAVAATLAMSTFSAANATNSARKFFSPDYLGQPVAFCLEGARGCGRPAATVWCRLNGYEKAISFARRSPAAGAELRFVDTGNICTAGDCITFSQIQCAKQAE